MNHFVYLLNLAKGNDIFKPIHTTTTKLVKMFGISQQSVSRILMDLEKKEFILRESSKKGVIIKYTDKAIDLLKENYYHLEKHFNPKKFVFDGIIKKGFSEGKYYISRPQYKKMFKDQLGMEPYAGTLNVEVTDDIVQRIKSNFSYVFIKGFTTKSRSFSSLKCYKCKINGKIDAFVIFIERTTHPSNIIEIISEDYVREKVKDLEVSVEMIS